MSIKHIHKIIDVGKNELNVMRSTLRVDSLYNRRTILVSHSPVEADIWHKVVPKYFLYIKALIFIMRPCNDVPISYDELGVSMFLPCDR